MDMDIIRVSLVGYMAAAATLLQQREDVSAMATEHGPRAIDYCLHGRDFRDDTERGFGAECFYNGTVFGMALAMALIANGALDITQIVRDKPEITP